MEVAILEGGGTTALDLVGDTEVEDEEAAIEVSVDDGTFFVVRGKKVELLSNKPIFATLTFLARCSAPAIPSFNNLANWAATSSDCDRLSWDDWAVVIDCVVFLLRDD